MIGLRQALRLFLVYALLWPITLGDRMVHLDAPTAEQTPCSSPWAVYRNLSRSLFGVSAAPVKIAAAMRVHSRSQPPASFPISKPGFVPAGPTRASQPIRRRPAPRLRPHPRPLAPPPPLALQVDSKE